MTKNLSQMKCAPCEGGMPAMSPSEAGGKLEEIPGWKLTSDAKKLARGFDFPDFKTALDFVNKVSKLAETEGHHPDIEFGWGRVKISLSTHAVGGLSINDFILAAKISEIHTNLH